MKNIIEYFKGKSLYILIGVVVLLILVIILSSCSNGGKSKSYTQIEDKMVSAAKRYYEKRENELPKELNESVKVDIDTLVQAGQLKEVYDIKDKSNKCTGYVDVVKVTDKEYAYVPYLTCKNNYEPKLLKDEIINSELDEYGNGVYTIEDEYIYRGEYVNNYVKFNEELWRIIKVDASGDIKIISDEALKGSYAYDNAYNNEKKGNYGITTDYMNTSIRKALDDYYKEHFTNDNKAKIVLKNVCIGPLLIDDSYNREKECAKIKENEKIGLLNPSDYKMASLSNECNIIKDRACENYNYLKDILNGLLINPNGISSYEALVVSGGISSTYAKDRANIYPVLYLKGDTIILDGEGTKDKPFVLK